MEWESDRDRRPEPHVFAGNLFIYFNFMSLSVLSQITATGTAESQGQPRSQYVAGPRQLCNVGATFSAMCIPSAAIHSSPARIVWGITPLSFPSNFDHSPSITSSHALPPGSPGDSLRGIQRRASGHKSAARRFLHKLQCDRRHPCTFNATACVTTRPAPTACPSGPVSRSTATSTQIIFLILFSPNHTLLFPTQRPPAQEVAHHREAGRRRRRDVSANRRFRARFERFWHRVHGAASTTTGAVSSSSCRPDDTCGSGRAPSRGETRRTLSTSLDASIWGRD